MLAVISVKIRIINANHILQPEGLEQVHGWFGFPASVPWLRPAWLAPTCPAYFIQADQQQTVQDACRSARHGFAPKKSIHAEYVCISYVNAHSPCLCPIQTFCVGQSLKCDVQQPPCVASASRIIPSDFSMSTAVWLFFSETLVT